MRNPPDESKRMGEFVPVPDAWFADGPPRVEGPAQARIVAGLRAMYVDLLHQPPPARFLAILAALDRQRGTEAHGS
jgi:hypothetical protein